MPVQHAPKAGWKPTAALGTTFGTNAAANAKAVGFPPGVTLWCDFEGPDSVSTADDATAYINAWAAAVNGAGYDPGLYVGSGAPLWKSESSVAEPANCGFCLIQLYTTTQVAGVEVDVDVVQFDCEGRLPYWLFGS
jgi:hypothetical protein